MNIKNINLNSSIGDGEVKIREENGKKYINVKVSNQVGVMKVYVIDSETFEKVHIGNLVNGRLEKEVNIDFEDIVITRDNKNVYWSCDVDDSACFARILKEDTLVLDNKKKDLENENKLEFEDENNLTNQKTKDQEPTFFENDKYQWKKVTDGSYFSNKPIIKHILNYPKVLKSIYDNKSYYYGVDNDNVAIAVKGDENSNPFEHLQDCSVFLEGYWVVCANINENYFYIYEYLSSDNK